MIVCTIKDMTCEIANVIHSLVINVYMYGITIQYFTSLHEDKTIATPYV